MWRGRRHAVGPVLLRARVAQADLVLVIEPGAVVAGRARIADPLAEARAHAAQVVRVGLTVSAAEVVHEVGVRADEAVPDVEHGLDLVVEHLSCHAQVAEVIVAEQDRLLEQREVGVRDGRRGDCGVPKV